MKKELTKKSSTSIVGQEDLVNKIGRIMQIFKTSQCEIRPHFILTGGSGSGKSMLVKNLTDAYELGFLEINAAALTKEGVSGNSLSKALSPLLQLSGRATVVFVDEFDKLFISGNSNSSAAHESSTGVQNEFLKVLESDEAVVFGDYGKYIPASIKNTLFVFAGAFNGEENISIDRLREIGIKTEFLGRVGLVFNTSPLTLNDMFLILEKSELLNRYLSLYEGVDRDVVINSLKSYIEENFEMNTLGARLITTIIHQYFITGGLKKADSKKISFQKKLQFS